jgi:hypothetical protein
MFSTCYLCPTFVKGVCVCKTTNMKSAQYFIQEEKSFHTDGWMDSWMEKHSYYQANGH